MVRDATDADFDAASRFLEVKIDVYFTEVPLSITNANYLVDADWLEEGSAESSSLFGSISSNELSFRIFNESDMFSPTNSAGPYFGKIKSGVPMVLSIRPISEVDEVNWKQLGVYYLTEWAAQVTGSFVDVTANDAWYKIFSSPMPDYPITLDVSYSTFMTQIFEALNISAAVDARLKEKLQYAFVEGTPKEFFQELCSAALGYVTSDKTGKPVVGAITKSNTVRQILTDDAQIKEIASKQAITKAYDGVELTYSVTQVSDVQKLVDLQGSAFKQGNNEITNVALSKGPLWNVSMVELKTSDSDVTLKSFKATQWQASLELACKVPKAYADLALYGRVLNRTELKLSDKSEKQLSVTNKYIQSSTYAAMYKEVLNNFINSDTPSLNVSTKGNPLLNIGDKVVIQSVKYKVQFTGVIQRLKYTYNGSLSCDMTLLNASVLPEVSQ